MKEVSLNSVSTHKRNNILTLAIALLFALFVALTSANIALAWLTDSMGVVNDLTMGAFSRTYAALYPSGEGYRMVLGSTSEEIEDADAEFIFYEIDGSLDAESVPWHDQAPMIESVLIENEISPNSLANWFNGCSNLKFLDLSNLRCKSSISDQANSESTFNTFAGCDRLEEVILPGSFFFPKNVSPYILNAPNPALIKDADGSWYIEAKGEGLSPEEVTDLVNGRIGSTESLHLYAYGSAYISLYGENYLVIGRGSPESSYEGKELLATYKGMEDATSDFSQNKVGAWSKEAYNWGSRAPWSDRKYSIAKVVSTASHPIKPLNMQNWFQGMSNCAYIDASSIDTSECVNLAGAFYGCRNLSELDVSNWDISNVRTIQYCFNGCNSLEVLDISGWDPVSLGQIDGSTQECFVDMWNVASLDLSKWSLDYGTTRNGMTIRGCSKIKEVDLSGFSIADSSKAECSIFSDSLEVLKVSDSMSLGAGGNRLQAPLKNRDGVFNSQYWYANDGLSPMSSEEVMQDINDQFSNRHGKINVYKTGRDFTVDDVFAAIYGQGQDYLVVIDRGSKDDIPCEYKDKPLSAVFREIEDKCIGALRSQSGLDANVICPFNDAVYSGYVTSLEIKTNIMPADLTGWFAYSSCKAIEGLEKVDASRSKSLDYVFYECPVSDLSGIEGWNTSNIESMKATFRYIKATSLEVSSWNTSKVKSMAGTFSSAFNLEDLDVSSWDVGSCENFFSMFYGNKFHQIDLTNWKFKKPSEWNGEYLSDMLASCVNLEYIDLSNMTVFNSQTNSLQNMLNNCSNLKKVLLPHFEQDSLVYTSRMLMNCPKLEELVVPNDFKFTQNSGDYYKVSLDNPIGNFYGVINSYWWYENGAGEALTNTDVEDQTQERFKIGDKGTTAYKVVKNWTDDDSYCAIYDNEMVFGRGSNIPQELNGKSIWDKGVYREIESDYFTAKWNSDAVLKSTVNKAIFISSMSPINLKGWFNGFANLASIENLNSLDTGEAIDMSEMFMNTKALRSLDLKGFDTSMNERMESMFSGSGVEDLDLSNFDTAKVENSYRGWQSIFENCNDLKKLDISGFSVANHNDKMNTYNMLKGCPSLREITIPSTFKFSYITGSPSDEHQYSLNNPGANSVFEYDGIWGSTLWFTDDSNAGLTGVEASMMINERFGSGAAPLTLRGYRQLTEDDAYAAFYKNADQAYLVFGRGLSIPKNYMGGCNLYKEIRYFEDGDNHLGNEEVMPWEYIFKTDTSLKSLITVDITAKIKPYKNARNWLKGDFCDKVNANHWQDDSWSNIDLSEVEDIRGMFSESKGLYSLGKENGILDLSQLDVKNVKLFTNDYSNNLGGVFSYSSSLKELNISGWDFSNRNIAPYDASRQLFVNLYNLEVLDMSNVVFPNMPSVFGGNNKLQTIILSDRISFSDEANMPDISSYYVPGWNGKWTIDGIDGQFTPDEVKHLINDRYLSGEGDITIRAAFNEAALCEEIIEDGVSEEEAIEQENGASSVGDADNTQGPFEASEETEGEFSAGSNEEFTEESQSVAGSLEDDPSAKPIEEMITSQAGLKSSKVQIRLLVNLKTGEVLPLWRLFR